jgi:hypothetical protein
MLSSNLLVAMLLVLPHSCLAFVACYNTQSLASKRTNLASVSDTTCNAGASSTTTSSIHLLSLNYPSQDVFLYNKELEDVWKWKDVALGDGRDFYFPKTKMLSILQSVIIMTFNSMVTIQECSILSNCARLDIVLVVCAREEEQEEKIMIDSFTQTVSSCLAAQVFAFETQNAGMEQVQQDTIPTDLSNHWTHVQGMPHVCRYLCWIAAGMATKPNCPTTPVEFRPFNSRDAHILWQLKRTSEIASGPIIQKVLQSALQVGKACRNVSKVPEISVLNSLSFSLVDVDAAKVAVIEQVIEPAVQDCVDSMRAAEQSKIIEQQRSTVMSWSQNDEEKKWLRKQLHGPTVESRTNVGFDWETEMETIQRRLLFGRREQNGARM